MSEKQNSGAPTETQPSGGFGGERRDSEASEQSLSRRVSRETSEPPEQSTPPQRNKPSSFYVYLAILYGAAFLMLLLAYFVQQRNNETVQDNLRTTIASREELMEDIQRLEEENLALQQDKEALETQLAELQRQKDELETDSFWREKDLQSQLASWHDLWVLEESFLNKDHEACAQFFRDVSTSNYYATPAEAAEQAEKIYNDLLEQGFLTEDVPLPIVYTAK